MPAWKNIKFAAAAALFIWASAPVTSARADFKVDTLTPTLTHAALEIGGSFLLALTPKVEEALNKGIPLDIVIDFKLQRQRPILWDQEIAEWILRRQVRYHALTGRYFVTTEMGASESRESFNSMSEALRRLGSLNELRFVVPNELPVGQYALDVRASLDIEGLPAPLRPVAYTSRAWHLNSGWLRWKVGY
jgi:hypothetical protein